ncbi:MAG: hypothetical protein IJR47_04390, partial [Clostridia bacterium]|nr:hypothetical protein [Clostridia bacterium]
MSTKRKRKTKKQREYIYKRVLPTLLFVACLLTALFLLIPKEQNVQKKPVENAVPFNAEEGDIKLKVLVQGSSREMYLEDYLVHVVAGEMYPSYDTEALKA